MVEMKLVYEGGLRTQSSHGPSGTTLETDAPVDNQGKGEAFSPTDLLATSLASCMLTTMAIRGGREGWILEGARAQPLRTERPAARLLPQVPPVAHPGARSGFDRADSRSG